MLSFEVIIEWFRAQIYEERMRVLTFVLPQNATKPSRVFKPQNVASVETDVDMIVFPRHIAILRYT